MSCNAMMTLRSCLTKEMFILTEQLLTNVTLSPQLKIILRQQRLWTTTRYICLIEASLLDDVIVSLPYCMHPNVAALYDVGFFRSFPMLMMERMEAPLSTLLSDVGDQVTLRERLM
jgi:hypothetical protein